MSSESATATTQDREESVHWRSIPQMAAVFGLVLCIYAFVDDQRQFAYSYLTAFMFFLSIGLGSLFLVLMHHLFDAGWSAPIRRFQEHLACLLFPWLMVAFIPIGFLGPEHIYGWMNADPATDHALAVKQVLFNKPVWYSLTVGLFLLWGWLTHRLRYWSLQQDKAGTDAFEGKPLFPENVFTFITKNMRRLVADRVERSLNAVLGSGGGSVAMLLGMIITISVQSSSITTSIMVPLAAAGVVSIHNIYPVTLGANVGTTITALLAALAASKPEALTIGLVHTLFNVGAIAILYPYKRVREIPIRLAQGLAQIAVTRQAVAIGYVVVMFIVIPLVGVAVFR